MNEDVKNVVENIDSMIEQLKMYMTDGSEEATVEEEYDEDEEMQKAEVDTDAVMQKLASGEPLSSDEQEAVANALAGKSASKAEDASSDADERVGELPDLTDESLSAIKSLLAAASKKNAAKKSKGADPEVAKLAEGLAVVMKAVQQQNETLENVLAGFGIADDAITTEQVKKAKTPKNDTTEREKTMAVLKELIQGNESGDVEKAGDLDETREAFKSQMGNIFRQNK